MVTRTAAQRVLVVDDEKNMRTTLADILADEGFEVTTADSGEKAVRICGQRPFDVILMDVRMPGIDGIEAFRRIRQRDRDIRVIMMSAYSLQYLEEEVLREGAVAFVRKPLDADQVLALIGDSDRRRP